MNPSLSLGRAAFVILCFGLVLPSGAQAEKLPSGQYRAVAILGPVYLDGRYLCFVDETEAGALTLSTSPTGALFGEATLAGETQDVVGQITLRRREIRLTLRGKAEEGEFSMKAVLKGGVFVGTVTMRGQKGPVRIEVAGVAPITASYDLTLTSEGNGDVAGIGTLLVGRTEIPVTAIGHFGQGKRSLKIAGAQTFLRSRTLRLEETGFTAAKWAAQGFGALVGGRHLVFTPAP